MKLKNYFFILSLISVLLFSCQKEISTVVQPQQAERLMPNTTAANLIQKTVTKDGSKDNIIDHANCLSVQLPVTVIANGLEITINSEADYALIEDVFDQFNFDVDHLDIIFPITIVLSDYTEITIQNMDELENYVNQCGGENEPDDDIECIDFVYPITFSIFDSASELTDTISVENDEQFYLFLEDMSESDIVQVNFPITVLLSDGTEETINNIDELTVAIDSAKNTCNEDDNNDYDDDDCLNCTVEQITEMLLTCSWMPSTVKINGQDNSEQYANYVFTFNENGSVVAEDNGIEVQGTWMIDQTDTGILVKISFETLADFSFNWSLHEHNEDLSEVDLTFEDNKLTLEKVCLDDKILLEDTLNEGSWLVANFTNNNIDETTNYNDFVLDFLPDGTVTAKKNNDVVNGAWKVEYHSGKLKLDLNFNDTLPFNQFNEDWTIVDVQAARVEVKHVDSDTNAESKIVFERI
jgi:hypothetical protein